jgi:hypothetical protein
MYYSVLQEFEQLNLQFFQPTEHGWSVCEGDASIILLELPTHYIQDQIKSAYS